jgi:type III secretion protein T
MTNDYVSLYLMLNTYPYTASAFLSLLLLTVARIFPIIALSPFFGGKILPRPVKVAFGLSLYAILLPKLLIITEEPIPFDTRLLMLFLKEIFIGALLGLLIMLPFWAAEAAGLFTDQQRGGASLQINDPIVQTQSSPLGTLYNFVLIYLFYLFDGPFLFIESVVETFDIVPPNAFISREFFNAEAPIWATLINLLNTTMKLAIRLAAPALLAVLMTDMFLGIINRMAPQVMITFLGMPLKSLLALTVVFLGWQLLIDQMAKESIIWLSHYRVIIHSLGIGSTT